MEDNGVGVSDELTEALNNTPHYMVCDTDITEQHRGLGLLIVRQITASHNGGVTIGHSPFEGFAA